MYLARDHVEGFQIEKKSGRKPQPKQAALDIMLCLEVWKAQEEGRPASSAHRRIVKRRREWGMPVTVAALRKRFDELMKLGPATRRMLREVNLYDELRKTRKKL